MVPVTCKTNWPLLFKPGDDMEGAGSGFTVIEKPWVALRMGEPVSATFKANALVVLALVTAGRQENAPLLVFNVALPMPLYREKVSVWGG